MCLKQTFQVDIVLALGYSQVQVNRASQRDMLGVLFTLFTAPMNGSDGYGNVFGSIVTSRIEALLKYILSI